MKPTPDDGREDAARDLGEHGRGAGRRRTRVHVHGEPRDADEHRDRDHAEDQERLAAFTPCGRRNALTPFAIASTPVSAVEPDAKARRTTNVRDRAETGRQRMRHDRESGTSRSRTRPKPTMISAKIDITNA